MRPIFFRWRGLKVHSYPAMQYIGLTLGVLAGYIAAGAWGLDQFRVYVATLILLFPALAGARILHVITRWREYRDARHRIWDTRRGGAAQYGGILLAVPVSVPLLGALDLPFGAFWDIGGVTIMVGMVFTRIGCFLNGCCAGKPACSRITLNLPNTRGEWTQRYPTQLFEAAWAAVLLFASLVIRSSLPFDGALFLFIASGYALGRLVMESMREMKPGARAFTIHHAISLFIIVSTIVAITARS